MIFKNSNISIRLSNQPTLEECLWELGVAVDTDACLGVTSFCWVNGIDDSAMFHNIIIDPTAEGVEL